MKKIAHLSILILFISCQEIQSPKLSFLASSHSSFILDNSPILCSENRVFHENKILFVIDKTKTNKKSDPDGHIRINGIKNFMKNNKNNNFGFIVFSKEVSSPLTINNIPVFRSNYSELEKAIEEIDEQKDEGKKNYLDLLSWIKKSIENDMRIPSRLLTDYYVMFISDGYPSASEEDQKQFIQGMKSFSDTYDNVHVHSAYYGQYKNRGSGFGEQLKTLSTTGVKLFIMIKTGFFIPFIPLFNSKKISQEEEEGSTDDVHFVKAVSEQNGGDYIDYNKNGNWNFQTQLEKIWNMDFFLVYNLNAGFCFDGYIGVDSDGDGLCDQDEDLIEGLNSDSRFSFNDGYGDYFHLLAINNQKTLPPCSDRSDDDHDLLTVCEEKYLNFLHSSELLSPKNPDSDADGVIDGIEAMIYLLNDASAPLDPNNLKNGDLSKITRHISPFSPEEKQIAHETVLSPLSGKNASCYGIQQNTLPLYPTISVSNTFKNMSHKKGENIILIYFMHKMENSSNYVYQWTYKKVRMMENQHQFRISLNDSQFQYFSFKKSKI